MHTLVKLRLILGIGVLATGAKPEEDRILLHANVTLGWNHKLGHPVND